MPSGLKHYPALFAHRIPYVGRKKKKSAESKCYGEKSTTLFYYGTSVDPIKCQHQVHGHNCTSLITTMYALTGHINHGYCLHKKSLPPTLNRGGTASLHLPNKKCLWCWFELCPYFPAFLLFDP